MYKGTLCCHGKRDWEDLCILGRTLLMEDSGVAEAPLSACSETLFLQLGRKHVHGLHIDISIG